MFQRGLKPHIAREVDLRDPTTLMEAMNYAIRADARSHLFYRAGSLSSNQSRFVGSRPIPMEVDNVNMEPPSDEKDDVPMAVNATFAQRPPDGRSPNNKRVGISISDRERCVKENRCFNCKQTGHIRRNCTKSYSKNF